MRGRDISRALVNRLWNSRRDRFNVRARSARTIRSERKKKKEEGERREKKARLIKCEEKSGNNLC